MDEMAFIEAALDDPEHYDLTGYPVRLKTTLQPLESRIQHLADTFEEGRIVREGLLTVILGKPNAGKSSLLNAMTGADRAIVTDIEGTTRDVLEEQVNIGGITLRLLDTAGIRGEKEADAIEKIGIEKAKESAGKADLILTVLDTSRKMDDNDRAILQMIRGRHAIVLLNKSDLEPVFDEHDVRKLFDGPVLTISAKNGQGIDRLGETIRQMFFNGRIHMNEEVMITNSRHRQLLLDALKSLKLVEQSIDDGMPEDFYSIDLMDAYRALGEIIGEEVDDDLVDTIFSKFCMGK